MHDRAPRCVQVPIHLTAQQYLQYYQGAARQVYAYDIQGRTVQFPANLLQRYVTRDGISGLFEICFEASGKLVSIRRVGD